MILKDAIEDVVADAGLPYSHLSNAPDGDVVVWYEDDTDDSTVTAIVQAVERSGVATYQGEEQYPHDSVTGLVFAKRDSLPIDVQDTASAVIEGCLEANDGDDDTVPITAIDEVELPKRLGEEVHQSVWDSAREAVRREVEAAGYKVV